MQKIIGEMNQNNASNMHVNYLKKELEAKNQTISNLESKIINSRAIQTPSPTLTDNSSLQKRKLKDLIEVEVKSLCSGLVSKPNSSSPQDQPYHSTLMNSQPNPSTSINTLLISDMLN